MTVPTVRLGEVVSKDYCDEVVVAPSTYAIAGVYGFGRGVFRRESISGTETKYKRLRRLRTGQLIFSKLKAFEGAVTLVTPDVDGCYVSHEFPTFWPGRRVDDGFLSHLIRWDGFVHSMRGQPTGVGARRERLHADDFLDIVIPLPDLPKQRRIAAHLAGVGHAARAVGSQRTSSAGQRLLNRLLDAMVWDTPLGVLVSLDVDEVTVDPSATYRQAGVYGHGRGLFLRGDLAGSETKYSRLRQVRAGQVVLSRLKAFEGAVAVVPSALDGTVVSPEFPSFSLSASVVPGFVAALIGRPRFWNAMQERSSGVGARRERLSAEEFLQLRVPSPPLDRQSEVATVFQSVTRMDLWVDQRERLANALLPAARNEVFSSLV